MSAEKDKQFTQEMLPRLHAIDAAVRYDNLDATAAFTKRLGAIFSTFDAVYGAGAAKSELTKLGVKS